MRPNTIETFWERVDIRGPDECWEWGARKDDKGYGQFHYKNKNRLAHRLAYEFTNGEGSLDGYLGCHTCDNPGCCNPAHTYPGTYRSNAVDRESRGRGAKFLGSRNPMSKLNEDQADMIREMLASGMRGDMIAEQFGVSKSTVSLIKSGQRWNPGSGGVGRESSYQESR